ncbi:hypothetical protein evm_003281 [Chilo suppressalis]|nr:hypothetical protein evm_003281 [Chilo suppressalis]
MQDKVCSVMCSDRVFMRRGSGGGCGWGGGVLGRWSLRRLLLDSPLVGRRLAHTVLEQTESRQTKQQATPVEQQTKQTQTTVEFIAEDEDGDILECPLCLSGVGGAGGANVVRLAWCAHRCCEPCLRQYLAIEIFEARVPVNCPVCHENMHPLDVRRILDNPVLYEKYEEFSVRRALAADPDTRWCPAPDCSFAVVASGCASCPKLTCLAPGCGASFCYHCKAAWHPTQTCDAARRTRQPPPRAPSANHADLDHGEALPYTTLHYTQTHRRPLLLPLQGGLAPHADLRRGPPHKATAAPRALRQPRGPGPRRPLLLPLQGGLAPHADLRRGPPHKATAAPRALRQPRGPGPR